MRCDSSRRMKTHQRWPMTTRSLVLQNSLRCPMWRHMHTIREEIMPNPWTSKFNIYWLAGFHNWPIIAFVYPQHDRAHVWLSRWRYSTFNECTYVDMALSSMGAWELCPFVKSIRPISLFCHSNFLPTFSACAYVFSIAWSVGPSHSSAPCSDTVL